MKILLNPTIHEGVNNETYHPHKEKMDFSKRVGHQLNQTANSMLVRSNSSQNKTILRIQDN